MLTDINPAKSEQLITSIETILNTLNTSMAYLKDVIDQKTKGPIWQVDAYGFQRDDWKKQRT